MSGTLEFTVLGCGSSGGVPRADGDWGACDSANPRNRRSRCSLSVRRKTSADPRAMTTIVVDTAPEFRLQSVAAELGRLDAVLFTHDHADQAHGLDDVRGFFHAQGAPIDCYMDAFTAARLTDRFGYAFRGEGGYPAILEARALPAHGTGWTVGGPSGDIPVTTFDLDHGDIRSVGYRFGNVAYSADVVSLPDDAVEAMRGLDVFVIDALRDRPHPTHAHVGRALEWIAELKPRRAILTNLHQDLDYAALTARLPPGVEAAYDGLRFEVPL